MPAKLLPLIIPDEAANRRPFPFAIMCWGGTAWPGRKGALARRGGTRGPWVGGQAWSRPQAHPAWEPLLRGGLEGVVIVKYRNL